MDNIMVDSWGISSELIIKEAEKLGFKTGIISKNKNMFWLLKDGNKHYFKSIDCGLNSSFGLKVANDKELTYLLAEENNIPIPKSIYININEIDSFNYNNLKLKYPVISKPVDGAHGDGVSLDLNSPEKVKKGVKFSFKEGKYKKVVIQEQIAGDDHRFFVVGNKVVSVAKRMPPSIVGNGINTIKELVEIENKNPKRGKGHDSIMSHIKIDDELINTISNYGLNLEHKLEKNKNIYVRKNANLSSGGLAIDMTDVSHEDNKRFAVKIANLLGLKTCGVDIFSTDISKSISDTNGAIIEVNATPGIRMHHFPSEGKGRNIALEIINML